MKKSILQLLLIYFFSNRCSKDIGKKEIELRAKLIQINSNYLKDYYIENSLNININCSENSLKNYVIKKYYDKNYFDARSLLIHELGHIFGNIKENFKYKIIGNIYTGNGACYPPTSKSILQNMISDLLGLISMSFFAGKICYIQYSYLLKDGDLIIFQNKFDKFCKEKKINNKDLLLNDIIIASNYFISKNYKLIEKIVDEELIPLIKNENFKSNILQNQFIEIEEQNENKDKFSISFNIDTNNSIIKTANNDLDIISKIINNNIQSGKYS